MYIPLFKRIWDNVRSITTTYFRYITIGHTTPSLKIITHEEVELTYMGKSCDINRGESYSTVVRFKCSEIESVSITIAFINLLYSEIFICSLT